MPDVFYDLKFEGKKYVNLLWSISLKHNLKYLSKFLFLLTSADRDPGNRTHTPVLVLLSPEHPQNSTRFVPTLLTLADRPQKRSLKAESIICFFFKVSFWNLTRKSQAWSFLGAVKIWHWRLISIYTHCWNQYGGTWLSMGLSKD